MIVKELSRKELNTCSKDVYDEKVKKLRTAYEKPCKGMFEFIDAQGGWLEFTIRFFKGEPIRYFRIDHGEIVELPMGIVKHLNNTRKKVRKFSNEIAIDKSERGLPRSFELVSRVRFTPMDVM